MPPVTNQNPEKKNKRMAAMEAGVYELERWLMDIMEQGLATIEQLPSHHWDDFAASMVNAKLGGIARKIRLIKQQFSLENWPEKIMAELAELFLFTQAFQRFDTLSSAQQKELLTLGGVTIKKEEVLQQAGVTDHWLVIGQRFSTEEKLQVRRTWLLGEQSQNYALLLDFAWGNQGFNDNWIVGSALHAEIVYYPAAYLQRALIKRFEPSSEPFNGLIGFVDFSTFAQSYAQAVSANPWLYHFPCLLDQVIPVFDQQHFLLVDQNRDQLPLGAKDLDGWKILAISTGHPIKVFGEWNGQFISLLSAVHDQRLIGFN